jgi:DNA (cytosine-5)-methyltransferase 1
MTHASLFSGIGGFDLAAQRSGYKNIFACEIDKFCQKVLRKNFPELEILGDIKEVDFNKYKGKINVLTGGFPCQPFSQVGKRKGKDDDRALFNEMLRAIEHIKPEYIIAENVTGITSIHNGKYFSEILTHLGNLHYKTICLDIPATIVGAHHRRRRIWIIAYPDSFGLQRQARQNGVFTGQNINREIFGNDWLTALAGIYRKLDGLSGGLDKNKRIKGLGNAIVPQIAEILLTAIKNIAEIQSETGQG